MGLFLDCFGALPDPRRGNARRHDLLELLTIALSATLCGAASCVDFELVASSERGVPPRGPELGGRALARYVLVSVRTRSR
jgi:hypothetical protein